MDIEIRDLRKGDYTKAIRFAVKGMHFDWYLNNRILLYAYGLYFWYLEINRATRILAAYHNDRFVGVLLAEIYGEKKLHRSLLQRLYVALVDVVQKAFFQGGAGLYEHTTKAQLTRYLQTNRPDGEIIFLAADPACKVRGVGTALLHALEETVRGKQLFLHTDDACTYQFYEHRGFTRVEETDIVLDLPGGQVPLKCLLYSKKI